MPAAISPLERLIIVTARKYLVSDARAVEEDIEPSKLPFTAQDALIVEATRYVK